jgi:hypothetical protein
MRGLALCKFLGSNNATRAHLVRSGVDRSRSAPAAIAAASALVAAFVATPALAAIRPITPLSVAAMFVATLLLGTLLARIRRRLPLLCLFRAFSLAAVPAMAATLAVFSSAVAALFLILLLLRRRLLAGEQLNQLSDKSKSHTGFL